MNGIAVLLSLASFVSGTYPKDVDHSVVFAVGGLGSPLSARSTTGYISISPGSEIFYWLFYGGEEYESKPLLVWVQGQIGMSSLVGALGGEFTPEWTKQYNILFVDAPVGTGFSTTSTEEYAKNSEDVAAQTVYFLELFFNRHTELKNAQVILAGEDYAGHTLPVTVRLILDHQEKEQLPFSVIGMAVGNGHTHAPIQVITKADSAAYLGLIDGPCNEEARRHAWAASVYSVSGNSGASLDERNKLEETILNCSPGINMGDVGEKVDPATGAQSPVYGEVQAWMNDENNLAAIGVKPLADGGKYLVKNPVVMTYISSDIMRVIWGHITAILNSNIPCLFYQGQLDWVDGVYSNEAWINALDWYGKDQYATVSREAWPGGYLRSFGPLTEAMVQGASHLALTNKNEELRALFGTTFSKPVVVPKKSKKSPQSALSVYPESADSVVLV